MKKTHKALLLLLCAVLLVAASVMGTLAYLTSEDTVTNTFTVGSVAITMDEAKVNKAGEKLNDKDEAWAEGDTLAARVDSNEYHLLPGHTYSKDPIVHVASTSENCYLFVKVVNEIADIEAETTVAKQMEKNGWSAVSGAENIFVYIGTADGATNPLAVAANSNITVFESFKIKDSVTNTELANYANKTIIVTAYAVQEDGFGSSTASYIWNTAFVTNSQQG